MQEIPPRPLWIDTISAVVYINLAERKERNQQILEELARLQIPQDKIERFEAIKCINGAEGCTRSRIACLENAQERNLKYLLLLEDDFLSVESVEKIHSLLDAAFQYLQGKFDVLYLAQTPIHFTKIPGIDRLHRVQAALATPAMIIHQNYISKLIESYKKSLQMNEPIDLQSQYLQPKDKWYAFWPPIARQRPGYSDIERKNVNYDYLELDGYMLKID